MKIKHSYPYGMGTREAQSISTYTQRELDGTDYDRGQLEAVGAGLDNGHAAFGRLLDLLAEKEIINANELVKIVENYETTEAKFEP